MLVIGHLFVQIVVWLHTSVQHVDTVCVVDFWVYRVGNVARLSGSTQAWIRVRID